MKPNKPKSIDPLEWDFSDCPDEELTECYLYEYARESAKFKAWHRAWLHWLSLQKLSANVPLGCWGTRYALRSECKAFPQTTWLKIPASKRRAVFHKVTFDQPGFDRARGESGGCEWLEWNTGDEVAKFTISWACPEPKIKADFAVWLKANRPAAMEAAQYQEAVATQGKAAVRAINPRVKWQTTRGKPPHWQSLLKALGALRLMRCYTAEEAIDFSQCHYAKLYPEKPEKVGPIYSDGPAMSEAKRHAQEEVRHFDEVFAEPFRPE